MIVECSVNIQPKSLSCVATNRIFGRQRPRRAAAFNHRQSRKSGRTIAGCVRTTRTRRLMSLLATISKILIIAFTMTAPNVGTAIAAAASATASAAAASMVTWSPTFFHSDHIQCPNLADNPTCPCYKFDDGNYHFSN